MKQVAIDMEFHHAMLALHKKVAPGRAIVGWYATGKEVTDTSVMIHEFYWKEMNRPPVHLTVDTDLKLSPDQKLGVKVFIQPTNCQFPNAVFFFFRLM